MGRGAPGALDRALAGACGGRQRLECPRPSGGPVPNGRRGAGAGDARRRRGGQLEPGTAPPGDGREWAHLVRELLDPRRPERPLGALEAPPGPRVRGLDPGRRLRAGAGLRPGGRPGGGAQSLPRGGRARGRAGGAPRGGDPCRPLDARSAAAQRRRGRSTPGRGTCAGARPPGDPGRRARGPGRGASALAADGSDGGPLHLGGAGVRGPSLCDRARAAAEAPARGQRAGGVPRLGRGRACGRAAGRGRPMARPRRHGHGP